MLRTGMRAFSFVASALGLVALLSTSVQSQEIAAIIVPDDAPTIQIAVDQANSGTTIVIRTGRYRESILIQKDNIRLVAAEDLGTVVIDGKELLGVTGIHLKNANRVEIRGLTIQNFDGFIGPDPHNYHAGILVEGGRANILRHNRLQFNGNNLVLVGSDNNEIHGNETLGARRAGIFLKDRSDKNTIQGNVAYDNDHRPLIEDPLSLPGCGIQISRGSRDNVVKDNELFRNGRGIMLEQGATGNQIIGNSVHDNARFGIVVFAGDSPATGNIIRNNVAINNAFRFVTNKDGGLIGDAGLDEGADLFEEGAGLFFDEQGANKTTNTWEDNIAEMSNVSSLTIACLVKQLCHNSDRLPPR